METEKRECIRIKNKDLESALRIYRNGSFFNVMWRNLGRGGICFDCDADLVEKSSFKVKTVDIDMKEVFVEGEILNREEKNGTIRYRAKFNNVREGLFEKVSLNNFFLLKNSHQEDNTQSQTERLYTKLIKDKKVIALYEVLKNTILILAFISACSVINLFLKFTGNDHSRFFAAITFIEKLAGTIVFIILCTKDIIETFKK